MSKIIEKEMKSEKKHVCEACGSSFNRPYRLTQHLLLHQNIKLYECDEEDCKKSYTSKSHLDRHITSVHIKPNFDVINRCPECMKIFSNRQNLKRHIKIKHMKKDVFTCDVCKTDFKKKHLLSTHMYHHTFVKSFSCDLCNKELISLHDKKKHMKHHKTYNCGQCNMAFTLWSKYQKHRQLEHNSKEFNCNECGRKFKQRHHMVHHAKTHMLVKPKVFPCWYEDCKRVYSRNSNLKQHIQMKHLQLKHACELCDAQLSTKAKLKEHLLNHYKSPDYKKPKTKDSGRKERKDKGAPKFSTALKIAGLFVNPDPNSEETNINSKGEPIENSNNNPYIYQEVGVEVRKREAKYAMKSGANEETITESDRKTPLISLEPINLIKPKVTVEIEREE